MGYFIAFLFGITILIFRKRLACLIIEQQNQFWGFKFGKKSVLCAVVVLTIIGCVVIIGGIILPLLPFKF